MIIALLKDVRSIKILKINIDQSQSFLTEAKLFAIPAGDDGAEFDETTEIEFNEKESPPKPIEIPTIIQPGSAFSMATATLTEKRIKTNSYRYVQLERALLKTNLLKKSDDRIKFENDYITSIQKNKFDEFLQSYYKKADDYHERIQKQEETKRERVFAFPDLEKNFLALDPTRDIKVVFIDEPKRSNLSRNAYVYVQNYFKCNKELFSKLKHISRGYMKDNILSCLNLLSEKIFFLIL